MGSATVTAGRGGQEPCAPQTARIATFVEVAHRAIATAELELGRQLLAANLLFSSREELCGVDDRAVERGTVRNRTVRAVSEVRQRPERVTLSDDLLGSPLAGEASILSDLLGLALLPGAVMARAVGVTTVPRVDVKAVDRCPAPLTGTGLGV